MCEDGILVLRPCFYEAAEALREGVVNRTPPVTAIRFGRRRTRGLSDDGQCDDWPDVGAWHGSRHIGQAARVAPETTTTGVEQIALQTSFRSAERMRSGFQRHLGVSGTDCRARFRAIPTAWPRPPRGRPKDHPPGSRNDRDMPRIVRHPRSRLAGLRALPDLSPSGRLSDNRTPSLLTASGLRRVIGLSGMDPEPPICMPCGRGFRRPGLALTYTDQG